MGVHTAAAQAGIAAQDMGERLERLKTTPYVGKRMPVKKWAQTKSRRKIQSSSRKRNRS